MQVGQRLAVIEPGGLGHEAFDQREHAVGAVDEAGERRAPVGAVVRRGPRRASASARAASSAGGSQRKVRK